MDKSIDDNSMAQWESPPWVKNAEISEDDLVEATTELLRKMTPEQRAKLLLEFPADEVVAVAEMLQSLNDNQ